MSKGGEREREGGRERVAGREGGSQRAAAMRDLFSRPVHTPALASSVGVGMGLSGRATTEGGVSTAQSRAVWNVETHALPRCAVLCCAV